MNVWLFKQCRAIALAVLAFPFFSVFADTPLIDMASSVKKPNFIVIIADDLGATDLGTYGHPVIKTPNIDQLAKAGLQFNQAFLTTSSCSASRASILTGLYPHSTGAPNLHEEIPADRLLVTHYLHQAGYYTAAIGKWHIGEQVRSQFDRSIDDGDDTKGDIHWLEELRNRPKDQPFFFWLASKDPHVPYDALKPDGPYQPDKSVITPLMFDGPGARDNIAQYYTEISHLDQSVGRVIAELTTQGVLDNTYVIFLSDNGASMPRAKTTLYDTGLQTPLIIRGPGVVAGKQSDSLVSSLDIMPMVLSLAGIHSANAMQGLSFERVLSSPATAHRQYIFAEQHAHGFPINKRAVRSESYLYIKNIGENKVNCLLEVQPMGKELTEAYRNKQLNEVQSICYRKKNPAEELFDVKNDHWQVNNLAADPAHAAVLDEMRKQLADYAKQTADEGVL